MVLVNHRDTIIFANRAAQHFFSDSTLLGQSWLALQKKQAPELMQHHDKNDAIIQFTMTESQLTISGSSEQEQSWHLSKHQLKFRVSPPMNRR